MSLKKFIRKLWQTDAPWRAAFGGLRSLHSENLRIDAIIREEFGQIDSEEWR